jgi:hypothetical protein
VRALRLLFPLLLAAACHAQTTAIATPAAPGPNGVVTGRVLCADTGLPARFASVSLSPIIDPNAKPQKASPSSAKPSYKLIHNDVETALDGSCTLTHVAPGVYNLSVEKDGYINPAMMVGQPHALENQILQPVTIEQNSTAHIDVQLQRGAAISGTITYDDGAPANSIFVEILSRDENGEWQTPQHVQYVVTSSITDDRGSFRLNSLLPGTYLLEANLRIAVNNLYLIDDGAGHSSRFADRTGESIIPFYGNGTSYIDQAPTFTLTSGEERTGQDMTIPISKLHKLTGRVAAGPNGHLVNAASVELISTISKKMIVSTRLGREDGLFHFEFVPEGDYTLHITNARDVTWDPPDPLPTGASILYSAPPSDKERVLKTYGDVDMPLILRGDMTDITATVPAKQTSSPAASN